MNQLVLAFQKITGKRLLLLAFFSFVICKPTFSQLETQINTCDAAAQLVCGDNTVTLPVSFYPEGTDVIVWYYFNVTSTITTPITLTSNTSDVYSIKIFGPFATTSAATACSDPSMVPSQSVSGGLLYENFTPTLTHFIPTVTFSPGFYVFHIRYDYHIHEELPLKQFMVNMECLLPPPPCQDCIPSFAPLAAKKYMVSAWSKQDAAAATVTSYTTPKLTVSSTTGAAYSVSFVPSGPIIDGWQKIDGEFFLPGAATDINITLECTAGNCFFDDIRVFPFDGSMKSYVYDPTTMRLVAELDERNYATIYEYDEEGKLVRVKKETERGIMTIKESRNNTSK